MEKLFEKKVTLSFDTIDDVDANVFPSKPYVSIVQANFSTMNPHKMARLADSLVDTQAMAVAAIGPNCTLFDDAVDCSFIDKNSENEEEMPHVLTTWHDDETIEDVIEYFSLIHVVDDWNVTKYDLLILKIGVAD